MASLSDFGLAPEEPNARPLRRRHYVLDDESGARPLPHGYDVKETYDDPLDEPVHLPGERRGLFFGVGAALGVAVLALAGALYLGGVVGARPELGPTLPDAPLAAGVRPFEEFSNGEALARSRIAAVWISEASSRAASTQQDSSDIQVVDQSGAPEATPTGASAPAPRDSNATSDVSGEELDAVAPAGAKPASGRLSNELDDLQRSLRPRGSTPPPKAPSNDQSAPEGSPLPAPAAPTAPAETTAPDNPY